MDLFVHYLVVSSPNLNPTPRANTAQELSAGAGIGTLLGLIVGLSASPVVSTVLGALAAGLLGLLGIAKPSPDAGSERTLSRGALRVAGFGFFCSMFLLIGLFLRTHGTLAPSLATQEQELTSSGVLSKEEVHQILLLKAFGLSEGTGKKEPGNLKPADSRNIGGIGISTPVLFGAGGEACQVLRREKYRDIASYIQALQVHGGKYAQLGNTLSHETVQAQDEIATSISDLICQ